VDTRAPSGRSLSLIVKFSRVAQDVPIVIDEGASGEISARDLVDVRFNSPMEEFGLVEELRIRGSDPRRTRVITQRPLAIYAPEEKCAVWELGRHPHQFGALSRLLVADQEDRVKAIELDIRRIYILVYRWIEGRDAEEWVHEGEIDEEEFHAFSRRVSRELGECGFRVLDNKPKHYILRRSPRTGKLIRDRRGRLAYGLVDYELLQRTPDHQREFRKARRHGYRSGRPSPPETSASAGDGGLLETTVFGVRYRFGSLADRGRLWVLGDDRALFDYFVPDRWRRTSRVRLARSNEVYRTRTRDGIEVVYRRSRVGMRPRVDPLRPAARAIRESGYVSPFEEVAVAERLRQLGVRTTRPRAILRTGHESQKALYLRDERAFRNHETLVTPDEIREPILRPGFDYYTIWDSFRGIPPPQAPEAEAVPLALAKEERLLPTGEWNEVLARAREGLVAIGLPGFAVENELSVFVDPEGRLVRDGGGRIEVALGLDGLTAYEFGLLDENGYRRIVDRTDERLRAADFEALNLHGRHLLLTFDSRGVARADPDGNLVATLCNFELVRGLYRPIR
jgi:hypothetical protein